MLRKWQKGKWWKEEHSTVYWAKAQKNVLERNSLKLSPFGWHLCKLWSTLHMGILVSPFSEHGTRVTHRLARYKPHQATFWCQRSIRIKGLSEAVNYPRRWDRGACLVRSWSQRQGAGEEGIDQMGANWLLKYPWPHVYCKLRHN